MDYKFTYKKNIRTIKIYVNNTNYYIFTNLEIIKIIYNSLTHQEESISTPKYPVNSYTGLTFSYENLSKCYANFILWGEYLPLELIMFKKCNFDLKKLVETYKKYFNRLAIKNWLIEIDNTYWLRIFNIFYKTFSLKRYICYKCIVQIPNFKNIFLNFVTEYFELINSFKSISVDYIKRLYIMVNALKIESEDKHYDKHIVILKKQRNLFKDTSIIINFSNDKNYIFGSN